MPFQDAGVDVGSFIHYVGYKNIWCVTHGCRVMDHLTDQGRAYLASNKFKEFIEEADKEIKTRNDCFYIEKPYEELTAKGV